LFPICFHLVDRSLRQVYGICARVAKRLGLTADYVRLVAVGLRRSDAVLEALKEEAARL